MIRLRHAIRVILPTICARVLSAVFEATGRSVGRRVSSGSNAPSTLQIMRDPYLPELLDRLDNDEDRRWDWDDAQAWHPPPPLHVLMLDLPSSHVSRRPY